MTTSPLKVSEIVGKGYDEFWNCKKRYRILKGGKGSKKSATTALNLIFRLMKEKDSNLLVVRQIFNTHRDSTFAQLKWAQEKLKVSHLWSNTVSPLEMVYKPTGQKIIFRGFDDVLKLAFPIPFTSKPRLPLTLGVRDIGLKNAFLTIMTSRLRRFQQTI